MLTAIRLLFISIFIFFIGLFFTLSSGISIEKFSFASINVSKLYIKLDKKLIVQIDEITLPATSSTQNSTNDVKKHIHYIPTLLTIFQKIDIESLKIKNNEFTITIDESIFYIDNKFINIAAKPVLDNAVVTLHLYSLYLKDYNLIFDGLLRANLDTEDMLFSGNMLYKNIEMNLNAQTNDDVIDFVIKSNKTFQNLHFIKDFIRLHPSIEEWMYDNVTGTMNLEFLQGQLHRDSFIPILSSLDGKALIEDANITFHPAVASVKTPLLSVTFKNDNLYFDLEKPMFKDIDIQGSQVVIHALSGEEEPSNIIIDLKTQHYLSQDILDILLAYDIALPIIQKGGSTQSQLAIQIYFKEYSLHTKGLFTTKDASFSLNGFDFFAHNATVELNDSIVSIKDSHVRIDELLEAQLNLDIDTHTQTAQGKTTIKDLTIQSQKTPLIYINTIDSDISIDYTRFTKITFPQLFTQISVLKDFTNIDIGNLTFVHPFSQLLQDLNIKQGSLNLNLHDKNTIDFRATLQNLDFPLQYKDGSKLNNLSLYGQVNHNKLLINSLDEKIKIRVENDQNFLTLHDFDIVNKSDTLLKNDSIETQIEIKGINSNVILNEKQKLLADSYTLHLKKEGLDLSLQHKGGELNFTKDLKEQISFNAHNMNDTFMNDLLGIENFFQDGNFTVVAQGTSKLINGNVVVINSKIKELALLNNLITFINTTPAIINPLLAIPTIFGMASNKGFNLAGYRIIEGSLDFTYDLKDDFFYINQLQTTGNMADFKATGAIDLAQRTIDSDVMIIFLKDYSKIIDYIPVVNYLFLGDEKNISTSVQIHGSLDDPQIQTNLTQDAAGASMNFIKRIFNLPAKGIELLTPSKND